HRRRPQRPGHLVRRLDLWPARRRGLLIRGRGGLPAAPAVSAFPRRPAAFRQGHFMKTLHSTLAGLLLATSALVAPAVAFAQQPQTAQEAPVPDEPVDEGTVDEIVVLGRF